MEMAKKGLFVGGLGLVLLGAGVSWTDIDVSSDATSIMALVAALPVILHLFTKNLPGADMVPMPVRSVLRNWAQLSSAPVAVYLTIGLIAFMNGAESVGLFGSIMAFIVLFGKQFNIPMIGPLMQSHGPVIHAALLVGFVFFDTLRDVVDNTTGSSASGVVMVGLGLGMILASIGMDRFMDSGASLKFNMDGSRHASNVKLL